VHCRGICLAIRAISGAPIGASLAYRGEHRCQMSICRGVLSTSVRPAIPSAAGWPWRFTHISPASRHLPGLEPCPEPLTERCCDCHGWPCPLLTGQLAPTPPLARPLRTISTYWRIGRFTSASAISLPAPARISVHWSTSSIIAAPTTRTASPSPCINDELIISAGTTEPAGHRTPAATPARAEPPGSLETRSPACRLPAP
jgi:hypothetical protein